MQKKCFVIALLLAIILTACGGGPVAGTPLHDFGAFLGVAGEDILQRSEGYQLIAVEGQDLSAETVRALKNDGHVVYGYLSVGSLENYRSYYEEFADQALGSYENWPDESWIDVSDRGWQTFVVDTLVPALKEKGFDGIFVDNCDVYYQYPTDEIYAGLKTIISGIRQADLAVMINGGDSFVTRMIEEGDADLINAISQETVFSSIEDYEADSFGRQEAEETEYFTEYVEGAAGAGIEVYLIEYTTDDALISEIDRYCTEHGFHYYVSEHVDLD